MHLDLQNNDWLKVDWIATEGKVGDWEHRRIHGLIDGRRMPMAQCEQCGETIYHGGRVTNFTPAIPTADLDELLAPLPGARRPFSVSEFLELRSVIAGDTTFSTRLYPLDVMLPLDWRVTARPEKHFYFPYAAYKVVSEEVRSIWETNQFTGVEFFPLGQATKRRSRPYHLFKITNFVKVPEPWTGCEFCEQQLACDYPEKVVKSPSDMPDIFCYFRDTLVRCDVYSAMKNAGVAGDLVVDRWECPPKDCDEQRAGRWVLLSGLVLPQ